MTGRLGVYIAGVRAGVLDRGARGGETFAYEPGYAGVPLSLSMPLSAETYGRAAVRPFLFGLLPDSRETRRELGRRHGVSGENPLALLEHIGLDCPGAVQVCPDESPELLERTDSLVALSESDVAMRLRDLNRSDDASWILDDEQWSLGGTQGKFAIRLRGDAWFRCEGSAATTHIVKPGITRLKYQALDEYASMRLARVVGLPAASVAYRNFEDEPAIVVARFDRRELPDGSVVRIHQEDMCQALSVMPDHKYTFEGGPAAADILALLGKADPTGRSVRSFVLMLFLTTSLAPRMRMQKTTRCCWDRMVPLRLRRFTMWRRYCPTRIRPASKRGPPWASVARTGSGASAAVRYGGSLGRTGWTRPCVWMRWETWQTAFCSTSIWCATTSRSCREGKSWANACFPPSRACAMRRLPSCKPTGFLRPERRRHAWRNGAAAVRKARAVALPVPRGAAPCPTL